MKSIPIKILSAIIAYCLVVVSVSVAKPVAHKRITVVVPTVGAARWPLNSIPDLDPLIKSHKLINTAKLKEFSNEYWTWIWLRSEIVALNHDFQTTPLDMRPEEAADVHDHYKLLELNDQSIFVFWFGYSLLATVTFAIDDSRYDDYAAVHVCQVGGASPKQCWSGEVDADNMRLSRGVLNLAPPECPPFIW